MSAATIKTNLIELVKSATSLTTHVYPNVKFFHDLDDLPIVNDVTQWWEVFWIKAIPHEICNSLVYYTYEFVINGYYSMNQDNSSQTEFEAKMDAIIDKLVTDLDVGGSAQFGDMEGDGVANVGLPTVELGISVRGGGTSEALHHGRITVYIRDVTPKTLSL